VTRSAIGTGTSVEAVGLNYFRIRAELRNSQIFDRNEYKEGIKKKKIKPSQTNIKAYCCRVEIEIITLFEISSLLTRKLPGSCLLKLGKANILEMSGEKQNKGKYVFLV